MKNPPKKGADWFQLDVRLPCHHLLTQLRQPDIYHIAIFIVFARNINSCFFVHFNKAQLCRLSIPIRRINVQTVSNGYLDLPSISQREIRERDLWGIQAWGKRNCQDSNVVELLNPTGKIGQDSCGRWLSGKLALCSGQANYIVKLHSVTSLLSTIVSGVVFRLPQLWLSLENCVIAYSETTLDLGAK